MPIQELKLNPAFNPNFWQPPPIVEPPADIVASTKNILCADCAQFFTVPRPRWTEHSRDLHQALSGEEGAADLSQEEQAKALALKTAALSCFCVHDPKRVSHNARDHKCDLCTLIHAKILDHSELGPVWRTWEQQSLSGSPVEEYSIRMVEDGHFRAGSSILIYVMDSNSRPIGYTHLAVLADVKTNHALLGKLPLSTTTYSAISLALCATWLQVCRKDHSKCKSSFFSPDTAPARLLDLSELKKDGTIKLHETSGTGEPYNYFTLSHCWGQCDRIRLVRHNIESFKKGFEVSRLATTFRDAIEITFKLGCQYLWIDCLCIIQDSENDEDWLLEASKMASVYGNALCNIAAGASSDSNGGCFKHRSLADVAFVRFERYPLPVFEGESIEGPVFIAKAQINQALDSNKGPLDARGWILQEQILAPRTLHFSKDQVFWECRQHTASETWLTGLPVDFSTSPTRIESKALFDQTTLLPNDDQSFSVNTPELLNHRWKTIVELYTSRNLTKAHDKLPALSGIADIFVDLIQDEYLAGLWKRTLLMDLGWWVSRETRKSNWPSKYRAPSWSWASVDGTVLWRAMIKHEYDMQAEIHNASVLPLQTTAKTSQVKDGSIQISGMTRSCVWRHDTKNLSGMQLTDGASNGWLDSEINLYPDFQPHNIPSTVMFFQLFRHHSATKYGSPWGRHQLQGLMLTPVDQTNNTYRRVGYFNAANVGYSKIRDDGWGHFVDGWISMRVTIV